VTPPPAAAAAPRRRSNNAIDIEEYFAPQRTPTQELGDPLPLVENLTLAVMEVLAGVREVDQLARWLGEDAYKALATRANLSARARSARGVSAARPTHRILSIHTSEPADSAIEVTVILSGPARTRAVAMRLEGWDNRWRATSLALL